jgi:hypothetical protein
MYIDEIISTDQLKFAKIWISWYVKYLLGASFALCSILGTGDRMLHPDLLGS